MAWLVAEATATALSCEPVRALTKQNLEDLYRLSKRHDLAHLLGTALDRYGLLPQDDLRQRFTKQAQLAMYRYEQSEYDLSRVCETLEQAGIPYLPLKGAVIRQLYAQPWMRTSCDLDVLVHEEDLARAIDLLVDTQGYTTDRKSHYHNVSLFSAGGTHLELHFNILECTPKIDVLLARVWEFATPIDGTYRYQLSNEFLLFYLIAHMARHFSEGGCGLKPLLDLHILRNQLSYDETELRALLSSCRIETFYNTMLHLLDVWISDGTHTALSQSCEDFLLNGGVYGTKLQKHASNKERHTSMKQYFWRRLFPSHERMQVLYPQIRSRKWLYPFFQLHRFSHLFRPHAIEKRIEELKIVQSISDEKRDSVVKMMNELGL